MFVYRAIEGARVAAAAWRVAYGDRPIDDSTEGDDTTSGRRKREL
jgi:hypothetical protein